MVSTFTPNIQLEQPARGDDVGTWDTPVNGNATIIDLVCGAINTISLNNSNVILTAAQYESKQITFNSTLTGSVTITFPTSFKKSYEIQNLCSGTSAFTITLQTTAASGEVICCPFGETIDCFNDGTNIRFKNLGRVGSYWDYAGSSVPNWVSGCTIPPYLNCDGTTFSSATYPQLTVVLGGTTLPDSRGRSRANLNQTTTRINSSNCGINGNTAYAAGGADQVTLATSQLPPNIPNQLNLNTGGTTYIWTTTPPSATNVTGGSGASFPTAGYTSVQLTGSVTINSSVGGNLHTNMPPTYIGGLTLIRAA